MVAIVLIYRCDDLIITGCFLQDMAHILFVIGKAANVTLALPLSESRNGKTSIFLSDHPPRYLDCFYA